MKFKLLLFFAFYIITTAINAQTGIPDSLKAQLIKDWQRAKSYTEAFLRAMPADQYEWQPHKDIRSFSKQMLHLTYLNIGFVSNGTGQPRDFFGIDLSTPIEETLSSQRDSVMKYTLAGYDFAIQGLQNMDAKELVKRGKAGELKISWINKAFEHQTHHRGQCVIYLRLLGIEPPHEQLF